MLPFAPCPDGYASPSCRAPPQRMLRPRVNSILTIWTACCGQRASHPTRDVSLQGGRQGPRPSPAAGDLVVNAMGFWACLQARRQQCRNQVLTAAALCAPSTNRPWACHCPAVADQQGGYHPGHRQERTNPGDLVFFNTMRRNQPRGHYTWGRQVHPFARSGSGDPGGHEHCLPGGKAVSTVRAATPARVPRRPGAPNSE